VTNIATSRKRKNRPQEQAAFPDDKAWRRFEVATDLLLKSKPQHKTAKKPARKRASKKR
jgi:hypothetical protein